MIPPRIVLPAFFAVCLPATAQAALPPPVLEMVEAAIATGNKDKVATVVEIAKQTNPDDSAEIETLYAAFKTQQAELSAAEKARQEEAIRTANLLQQWSGRAEIGGFRTTGNTSNTGVTGSLKLTRKGIDWTHKLSGTVDYQRAAGRTSREKFFAAYEPHYQLSERAFVYGLSQFERDRPQGFSVRYAASGGFGYHLIDQKDLDLSVKAGPAFRHTDYVLGGSDSRLAALLALDFDWRITDRIKLTQDANAVAETGGEVQAIIDSRSTTLKLVTGLEAKITNRLNTRLAYTVDYDSSPRPGFSDLDTISRFSFVYGF